MLCFLPSQNVVQEESGGPQQATGVGAYDLLPKLFGALEIRYAGAGRGLIELTRTSSRAACITHG